MRPISLFSCSLDFLCYWPVIFGNSPLKVIFKNILQIIPSSLHIPSKSSVAVLNESHLLQYQTDEGEASTMPRRRNHESQSHHDLDTNDLKYNVDFEAHNITRNNTWSGHLPPSSRPPHSFEDEYNDLGYRLSETEVDDVFDSLKDLSMNPRKHSTRSGAQGGRSRTVPSREMWTTLTTRMPILLDNRKVGHHVGDEVEHLVALTSWTALKKRAWILVDLRRVAHLVEDEGKHLITPTKWTALTKGTSTLVDLRQVAHHVEDEGKHLVTPTKWTVLTKGTSTLVDLRQVARSMGDEVQDLDL